MFVYVYMKRKAEFFMLFFCVEKAIEINPTAK
jgi:hypothetical protein